MIQLKITDNHSGKDFSEDLPEISEREHAFTDLESIANKNITSLCKENPNLLIFPHSLNVYNDYIGEQNILNVDNGKITTSNIMGFVGRNQTRLHISSRFYPRKNDFFLHYMLQKVFSINMFDLKIGKSEDRIWDFLLYLFPYYVNRALSQGLYKEYKKNQYNDANIKGVVNINRHINSNIPFNGKIAYSAREFDHNNKITQLIRHTIEHIKKHPFGKGILENSSDTQLNVQAILAATPDYNKRERQKIMQKNIRPLNHPWFYKYVDLQKICLQILRHETLSIGEEKDEIYGLLFDGAWLWEEYLNTFLKNMNFMHPRNKEGKDRIPLFYKPKRHNEYRYPDFYNKLCVIDAKYKSGNSYKEDLNQIICYMYIMKLPLGAFLYPSRETMKLDNLGKLNGYGGEVYQLFLPISQEEDCFSSFCKNMQRTESLFTDKLHPLIQQAQVSNADIC
ncbi:hypothetical protein QA597_10600 [Marinilabiliaceae bacterium ANBcel2]|nr:hypothetical protein [Marinilabiliaceae bacterium ANBcel2]